MVKYQHHRDTPQVPLSGKALAAIAAFPTAGPRHLWENHSPRKALSLEEAEHVCDFLRRAGYHAEPYHFPKTSGVWRHCNEQQVPYPLVATKELIMAIATDLEVDFRKPAGFKKILPHLTVETFRTYFVDQWETTVAGALNYYSSSPSALVLELIASDPDFRYIRRVGIDAGDFPAAPNNFFINSDGTLTEHAQEKSLQFIKKLAKQVRVDKRGRRANYRNPQHFKRLLPKLGGSRVKTMPINYWGTTLSTVLKHYKGSPTNMFLTLIYSHKDFSKIADIGIAATDFKKAPNGTWKDLNGRPTQTARDIVALLIEKTAEDHKVERPFTISGVVSLYPHIKSGWKQTQLSYWGTTARSAIEEGYRGSPTLALLDVVRSHPRFRRARKQLCLFLTSKL